MDCQCKRALAPRFGIVTLSTAHSVNSMFNTAWGLPSMDALNKIIDVMMRRFFSCRKKYECDDAFVVLVHHYWHLLNTQWEDTASISVLEWFDGGSVYTKSMCKYGGVDDEEDGNERNQEGESRKERLLWQHNSTYLVKPAHMWCSCDVWQDTSSPCPHAFAVHRTSKLRDNLINKYYTYWSVQATSKIYPLNLDTVANNGETKPPLCNKRSSGQPRIKLVRIRGVWGFADLMFKRWSSSRQQENLFCNYIHRQHVTYWI